MNNVSRSIPSVLELKDENTINDPKPIPIELNICEVALTHTWISLRKGISLRIITDESP